MKLSADFSVLGAQLYSKAHSVTMVSQRTMQRWLALALAAVTQAKNVTYNWNITWVTTSPDGTERPTIGINNQWPVPILSADVGDHIVVNVHNQLGDEPTSLHFHGLYMNGSTHMDGPVGVSQCSIPPGSSFKYEFDVRLC